MARMCRDPDTYLPQLVTMLSGNMQRPPCVVILAVVDIKIRGVVLKDMCHVTLQTLCLIMDNGVDRSEKIDFFAQSLK